MPMMHSDATDWATVADVEDVVPPPEDDDVPDVSGVVLLFKNCLYAPSSYVVHGEKLPPAPLYFATAALALVSGSFRAESVPNWGSESPGVICHSPHPVVAYGWPFCVLSGISDDSASAIAAAVAAWSAGPPAAIQ
jgi:hypothetical protein